MLLGTLLPIGILWMKLINSSEMSYKLCSCCGTPGLHRGVELNNSMCAHAGPIPYGYTVSKNVTLCNNTMFNDENIKLILEFLMDYVFYPESLYPLVEITDALVWSTLDKKIVNITTNNEITKLYCTSIYDIYFDDKNNYVYYKCC